MIAFSRLVRLALAPAFVLALAACGTTDGGLSPQAQAPAPTPAAPAEGVTRVALLVPLSATGGGAAAATSIKNAAEMAVAEFGVGSIELIVKDDLGTPAGATAAAQQAIAEGAQVILGPLFAPSVAAAGAAARAAGVTVIAFSSDANVATQGVYLLSFLPQNDVDRIVTHAAGAGKRSFAAIIPDSAYGTVAEGAFQQAVARVGGRVATLERAAADAGAITAATARVIALVKAGQADVIFAPFDAAGIQTVGQALAAAGLNASTVTLIGTGLWDDPRVASNPTLEGALFAAPDGAGFKAFAERYRARYNADPVRLATVGYDAVSLVKALVKTQGPQALAPATIANPSGFVGVDGAFRFLADGTNQRGLAVMRVTPQGPQIVAPAARSFSS